MPAFKKHIFFLAMFLLFLLDCNADSQPKEPVVVINNMKIITTATLSGHYEALGDFNTIVIPIKRAGKLILMDAVIDSVQGNLILDTGSAGIVLNNIYFRGNRKNSNMVSGGITGSMGAVDKALVKSLQISDVSYKDIETNLADLGHLESARRVKILGFLVYVCFLILN